MSHDGWSIVLVYGAGWIASTLIFIFAVFPERDRFEVRQAVRWGTVIVAHVCIWIVGMLNA